MNKVLGLVLASVVALSVASYAGSGCCAAGKAKAEAKTSCIANDTLTKLNLSDDQKSQVANLMESCKKATSKSECRTLMSDGLGKILTASQYAQWKADCDKATGTGECPYTKAQK
jgi:hypothetical protein